MLIPATSKARVRCTGISPLHLAAERNRNNILEELIESGFDVNARLSEDRSMMYEDRRSTVLYFAVMNNNIDATTILLKAGANPNLDMFNPLLVALRQGCIQTVILLVEHGANVNAYISTHPTTFPAGVMFCMKYLTLLKYLMDNGCDALSCFNCVYGSNPHPPIKTRRNSRYDPDEVVEKTCVQVSGLKPILLFTNCILCILPHSRLLFIVLWGDLYRNQLPLGRTDYRCTAWLCWACETLCTTPWASGQLQQVAVHQRESKYVHPFLLLKLFIYANDFSHLCIHLLVLIAVPPRPLMQLCRLKIRKLLGIKRLKKIHRLPVPPRLIKFLNHQEREEDI